MASAAAVAHLLFALFFSVQGNVYIFIYILVLLLFPMSDNYVERWYM